jgi:cytochrome c
MSSLPRLLPLALAGLLLAGAVSLRAAEKDRAAAGLDLAQKYCARCHAVTETGQSPHKQAPPFRTFASKWPLENLEEALAEGIVTGHPDMPAFVFEPDEIDALIEYLYKLAPEPRDQN